MLSKLTPNYNLRDHDSIGRVILDKNGKKQLSPRPGGELLMVVPELMHLYRYTTNSDDTKTTRTSYASMKAKNQITVTNTSMKTKICNDPESLSTDIFTSPLYKQNYITYTASKDANWDGIDIVTKSNGRITKREMPSDTALKCSFIGGISSHGVVALNDRDLSDGTYDIEGTPDTSLNTSFIYSGDIAHKSFSACNCTYCSGCELPQLSKHLDDLITLLMDNKIIGELT